MNKQCGPSLSLDMYKNGHMEIYAYLMLFGGTVIIMTHRPVAISECDKLMVIDGGRVKGLGPRDEILKSMMKNAGDIQRVIGKEA